MKKRLTLRTERLGEITALSDADLAGLVGGTLPDSIEWSAVSCPTIPDVVTCGSRFC